MKTQVGQWLISFKYRGATDSFFTDFLGCSKPRKREEKQEKLGNFIKNEKFTDFYHLFLLFLAFSSFYTLFYVQENE